MRETYQWESKNLKCISIENIHKILGDSMKERELISNRMSGGRKALSRSIQLTDRSRDRNREERVSRHNALDCLDRGTWRRSSWLGDDGLFEQIILQSLRLRGQVQDSRKSRDIGREEHNTSLKQKKKRKRNIQSTHPKGLQRPPNTNKADHSSVWPKRWEEEPQGA